MILITGGTGFIGSRLAARLAAEGKPVRAAARGVRASSLPAEVEAVTANVITGEGLQKALQGVESIAHLVAIIVERGPLTFDAVIRGGTERLVEAAQAAGVRKIVYVSAVGADPDPRFPYWAAKWKAEQAVIGSGITYTILRPSIVFGPEDDFFNRLAGLVRWNPIVPVAGDGKTLFQPIWVEDLVTCITACLEEGTHDNQIIEVGGPERLTYEEMLDTVRRELGARRLKVHVPLPVVRALARAMEAVLPRPLVTRQQLAMLAKDNTAESDGVLRHFGFTPKRLSDELGYIKKR
jgi:NADH dehydrogenase